MKIIKSKVLGYCYGVKNSVLKAQNCFERAEKENLPLYSIGQLIHNPDVVKIFEKKGMTLINNANQFKPGIALISAHGISDKCKKEYEEKNFILVDSTCTNILKSQEQIRKAQAYNHTVLVVGIENHAETQCLIGTGNTDKNRMFLISCAEDARKIIREIKSNETICVITQTTFPEIDFGEIENILKNNFCNIYFANQVCPACILRQTEAINLCKECNVVLVVGGKNSKNTINLANTVKAQGKDCFLVENTDDITPSLVAKLKNYEKIGVCSGTSTPLDTVEKVIQKLYTEAEFMEKK